MLIDCQTCVVRDIECGDCVVTALLGPMPSSLDQDLPVLKVLADAGLTKPLRLVKGEGQSGDRASGVSASSTNEGSKNSATATGAHSNSSSATG